MPTNRTRQSRNMRPRPFSPAMRSYFELGHYDVGDEGAADVFLMEASEDQEKAVWNGVKEEILISWMRENPCLRPSAWWAWDAPEPRQRLGGTGTSWLELGYDQYGLDRGIPTKWVSNRDIEVYNGRFRDIHGNIIPSSFKEGDLKGIVIDPANPPIYESEASYLARLGLLSAAEKAYLREHPELLEPEKVNLEEA